MKFAVSVAAIALAGLSAPAFAQEAASFSGPYVGAVGGYDHLSIGDSTGREGIDGFGYGVNLGYDMNFSGAVFGVEGEVTGSTAKKTYRDGTDTVVAKAGRDFYAGIRAGFAVAPATLVYVKGGYANGRITGNVTTGGTTYVLADNVDGVRLGAGLEQAFGQFSGRLEYRYTDYSNIELLGVNTGLDMKRHQVVASALVRF